MSSNVEVEIDLLLKLGAPDDRQRQVGAGVLSFFAHLALIMALSIMPQDFLAGPPRRQGPEITVARRVTPLVAPKLDITQKAPNRGKVSKEFDLESLLPRPEMKTPPATASTTRPAASRSAPVPAVPPPVPAPVVAPPRMDPSQTDLAQMGPPAPQIQLPPPKEQPKLTFETPQAASSGTGRIQPPSQSLEETVRVMPRPGRAGGLMVGDLGEGIGGIGESLNQPARSGRTGSTLELMSDPQGVDFKPYLIRILSSVRRNWFAVIPESAKIGGRRGRVIIQFAISKNGSVPKLVIAVPSGADPLDRAAVAGISASNPFPPLPAEFKGEQIRLQFSFVYNGGN